MKQIAVGLVMAAAVLALASSQERTQRRIDELHRHYQGLIKEARKEGHRAGVDQARGAPIVTELPHGLFSLSDKPEPKGFRSRFTR